MKHLEVNSLPKITQLVSGGIGDPGHEVVFFTADNYGGMKNLLEFPSWTFNLNDLGSLCLFKTSVSEEELQLLTNRKWHHNC